MSNPIANYEQFLSADEIAALSAALEQPLYPSIRLNTLKVDRSIIEAWAVRFGWQLEPVSFCATGWQILNNPEIPLGRTLPHRMGQYYIQDAASMIPVEMFSEADRPFILDMAAAPGGKTTHLVDRYADRAFIVANDSSQKRMTALRSNLQTWGAMGVMLSNYAGEQLGNWFNEAFDKVLLDAPCSGDTLREETGNKKRHVSDTERERLSQRQLALLISGVRALRVGGELVYSTCTLNPEENEGVLSALVRDYPVEIEAVEGFPHTGIVAEGFHPSVGRAVRLWPHLFRTSGFFSARLRKLDVVPAIELEPPTSHGTWVRVRDEKISSIVQQLKDDYSFDFEPIIAEYRLDLYRKGEHIYAIPTNLMAEFGDLTVMSIGLLIGQYEKSRFIPSHEFVSRFWEQFIGCRYLLADPQLQDIWLAGRDLRNVEVPQSLMKQVLLLHNEHEEFIGRGHAQPTRIRNLLPKRVI